MKQKVIFFDRDGTLIEDKHHLNDPAQVIYLKDVFLSLKKLRNLGFKFAIATNQSGIARGLVDIDNLKRIHQIIRTDFSRHGIDFLDFYYSPYMPSSYHPTRKPRPGMLTNAASEHNIDLSQSWMVGDKMTDIEAGHRAGCKSILLTETSLRPEPQIDLGFGLQLRSQTNRLSKIQPPEITTTNHSQLPSALKTYLGS